MSCPDLQPGRLYDLASIVAPIPSRAGRPPMAIRITGMPASVPAEQVESWADALKRVVAAAGEAMTDTRG